MLRVAIVLFDEVEVLDACGPFEVFSVANRMAERASSAPPFEVVTVTPQDPASPVRARGGLRLVADHGLADAPQPDVLVVPGGVVDAVAADRALLEWLRGVRDRAELVASVCNGAFVLAAAGLLHGPVTTHWEDSGELARRHPDLEVRTDARYVDTGAVATSAGVSAGIDLSLHLVHRYAGLGLASSTARQMDYPWSPDQGEELPPLSGEGWSRSRAGRRARQTPCGQTPN